MSSEPSLKKRQFYLPFIDFGDGSKMTAVTGIANSNEGSSIRLKITFDS